MHRQKEVRTREKERIGKKERKISIWLINNDVSNSKDRK
jgi:hypothetical protein